MFKTWFYTNIYNVYTNYCLILQIFKVWAVVYLSYFITSILFVMLWVDECLQAVVIHLLSVYISITPVKVIQLTFSYFLSFFAITVPDNIWFIQHFYIFFIINFCIFYHVKKISMSERTSIIWEIKDGVDSVGGVDGMHL